MTDVFEAIVEDGGAPAVEKIIDDYSGFLFYDKEGKSLVVMNWQHRFNNEEELKRIEKFRKAQAKIEKKRCQIGIVEDV